LLLNSGHDNFAQSCVDRQGLCRTTPLHLVICVLSFQVFQIAIYSNCASYCFDSLRSIGLITHSRVSFGHCSDCRISLATANGPFPVLKSVDDGICSRLFMTSGLAVGHIITIWRWRHTGNDWSTGSRAVTCAVSARATIKPKWQLLKTVCSRRAL
jgi:hypothetical protein